MQPPLSYAELLLNEQLIISKLHCISETIYIAPPYDVLAILLIKIELLICVLQFLTKLI